MLFDAWSAVHPNEPHPPIPDDYLVETREGVEAVVRFDRAIVPTLDVPVVEVGLGGPWDPTNVADGQVPVVTPIDLDHTHPLTVLLAEQSHRPEPLRLASRHLQRPDPVALLDPLIDRGEGFVLRIFKMFGFILRFATDIIDLW